MGTIESQFIATTKLSRIAWLSSQEPTRVFHSLMHHINVESLRSCYHRLDGKKATGTDGISKAEYGENLEVNLEDLIQRMKRMSYRPRPVREVLIDKEGKPGAKRPLGIANFEDKLVQKRMQEILEAIYDPIFRDCSYGFRPGRGCHDAIKALHTYLFRNEVEVVIDVDLANFFGTIDHGLLKQMLQEKIKDSRFIRYICRLFKAGVLSEGELTVTDEGVPQGSCCSPVMSNVFAHYVIDEWFNDVVKSHVKGPVEMMRYADDCVICCRYASDAGRITDALSKRLVKYKLQLNREKTKLVSFSKRQYRQGVKQEAFEFLGFIFYLGKTRKGTPIPKLKTSGTRLRSKLKRMNLWARRSRNKYPLREVWRRYRTMLRGHIQYYGVTHNSGATAAYAVHSTRIMFKWLNRRSQRKSFDWEHFQLFVERYPLPPVKIYHRLY